MCKLFYCDHRGDRFCCHECGNRGKCANPCVNDPLKCGQSFNKATVRVKCGNCAHAIEPFKYAGYVYCTKRMDSMMGICSHACEKYEQREDRASERT